METPINVLQYTDFRKFISDFLSASKSNELKISLRGLAEKSGIDACNLVKALKSERNLAPAAAKKLSRGLGLKEKERDYFLCLVAYCQARTHEEKKKHFEAMMSFTESSIRILHADEYEFYDKWYYTAVREALSFYQCDGTNCEALGKIIKPKISADEVKSSLNLLERLKFINKNEKGFYQRTEPVLSSGYDARSVALNNHIINSMDLARSHIGKSSGQINHSAVAFSVSEEDFRKIEDEIRQFRRRILDMARQSEKPDRVYQFNMQLFPLSEPYAGEGA